MPIFLPAALSGVNSWTERDSVLNSFKAIGSAQVKVQATKAKGEIYFIRAVGWGERTHGGKEAV
jgi:hypothetical protein